MALIKSLPRIAAKELRNTHCSLRNLKFKLELIADAYTTAAVEADFRAWCRSGEDGTKSKYPIFEYMKVIDARLGSAPEESRADTQDPAVGEIQSLAYELTGQLPAKISIANVLLTYSAEDITAALREYVEDRPDKDLKVDMKAFWSEGGCAAVILARKRRADASKSNS